MKRVFPVIVLLIGLSVVGILFIQMQWIQSAVKVKKDQYEQNRAKAAKDIQQSLHDLFLIKYAQNGGMTPTDQISREYLLAQKFTTQIFTEDEVNMQVRKALHTNDIKEPFAYKILNIFSFAIHSSENYGTIQVDNPINISLTGDNAGQKETMLLYIRENNNYIISSMGWMIVASIVLTTIIISAFTLTVRTLFNQKKLSEIKSDFINNMTHELKTPLATISLAVDALVNKKVISDEDKIRYYSKMIREENTRMNKQVETILQAARIERQEMTLNLERLNAHEVIQKVAANLTLQIQEKHGTLAINLKAARHFVQADEVHFSNIIFNLLDNAIKYSREGVPLHIIVETVNNGNMLAIRFKDNGIGMNKETQMRVFEKFYRAHTGNLHNVKGFGLGLSYVKAMIDAHHGRIKIDSTPGKGSMFIVSLPAA